MNVAIYECLKGNCALRIIAYVVLGLCVIIPMIIQMIDPIAHVDSGYYLSISNRITEGYRLYKDVNCGYTPLFIYICAGFRLLFNIPLNLYWPYLLMFQFFRIGCACFVYGIAKEFRATSWWAYVAAFYCLFIFVRIEGQAVLLEIPSSFWGLFACYATLKLRGKNLLNALWIGILISFSFLTKQYGLGFLPLVLYLIYAYSIRREWIIRTIYVLVGFILPIIFCYFYFGENFISVLFPSYGTQTAIEAGFEWTLLDRLKGIIQVILHCSKTNSSIIIISILLFPIAVKLGVWKPWLFALCGFLGFSLQFFFTNNSLGGHYLLYMFPFVSIMISNVVNLRYGKVSTIVTYICISYMVLWQCYRMFERNIPYWLYNKTEKNRVMPIADYLNNQIPYGSVVWIEPIRLEPVYFYANILPPNLSTIGYSFGTLGLNRDDAFLQIKSANYVILQTKGEPNYSYSEYIKEQCTKYDSIMTIGLYTIYKNDEYTIQ